MGKEYLGTRESWDYLKWREGEDVSKGVGRKFGNQEFVPTCSLIGHLKVFYGYRSRVVIGWYSPKDPYFGPVYLKILRSLLRVGLTSWYQRGLEK